MNVNNIAEEVIIETLRRKVVVLGLILVKAIVYRVKTNQGVNRLSIAIMEERYS